MNQIVNKFKEIPTTCIADALNSCNILDPDIRPIDEQYKFAGRALTVNVEEGDASSVLKAIDYLNPGDVIIIDAKGNRNLAVMGDFVLGMFKKLNVGAVVINGVIRDIHGVKALNIPVFCKGTTPAASNIGNKGEINVPISIGDTVIHPGDIIVGDVDGIVVVPIEHSQKILTKALGYLAKDETHNKVLTGNNDSMKMYVNTMLSTKKE